MAMNSLVTSPSSLLVMVLITTFSFSTFSLPFIVIVGLGGDCSDFSLFTKNLSDWSASQGYCMEIGNGRQDSILKPVQEQEEIVCDKVKKMKELSEGFNLVAISQGNMIGRALIEFCDGLPPIKNMVALGGPHAGTAKVPCDDSNDICSLAICIVNSAVYSECVQARIAPSNYFKVPTEIPTYLSECKFLPKLNNELPDGRNATYKERFTSLQNLVLIMYDKDTVVVPKESSWFGYYQDGTFDKVLPPQQTKLYIEDWIGLRTLDEAGKVKYIRLPGGHTETSPSEMKEYIVPYLTDESVTETTSSNQGTFRSQ